MPKHTSAIHPYFKLGKKIAPRAAGAAASWSMPDLCKAYSWPTGLVGGGVIAIIELGGGWLTSDVMAYFQSIGQPAPFITDVSVDGTTNTPGVSDADGEVALDIQIAGASYYVATGKPAQIRMYWAQDIAAAVRAAAKDKCDVCSISWGADEAAWGLAAATDMEQAAIEATTAGMAIFAASGDNDSGDGGATPANVDLPAAAPHVIGCGGTNKQHGSGGAETVWNNNPGQSSGEGTGGGYSTMFPAQAWQIGAPPAPSGLGRLVPDVAANADPDTGYEVYFAGQAQVVGGTSAVAPLYAGLFAALGTKLGCIGPKLWRNPGAFYDVTSGDNGIYHARTGPDACTGLGAPSGVSLAVAFGAQKPVQHPPPGSTPPPPLPPIVPAPTLAQVSAAVTGGIASIPGHATNVTRHAATSAAIAAVKKLYP